MRLAALLAALVLALPALAAEPSKTTLTASPATGRMDQAATLSATVGIGYSTEAPASAKLGVGYSHSCAVTAAGGVRCWGENGFGQLGDGTTTDRSLPVAVRGVGGAGTMTGVKAVAVGDYHTCALTSAGSVACWGDNDFGQLGVDTGGADKTSPVLVPGVAKAVAIAAGGYHACALTATGAVVCWGWNSKGQIGNGMAAAPALAPTAVAGRSGATAIAAGGYHSCALLAGGKVSCWGWNIDGQAGKGAASAQEPSPVPVAGVGGAGVLAGATAIAAGDAHSCAILTKGAVACWGDNSDDQLGDGSGTDQPFPVAVKGAGGYGALSGIAGLGLGAEHSCGRTGAGAVLCWGYNELGQLGDGTRVSSLYPVAVAGSLGKAAAVAAGAYHSCAVLTDGRLTCWGYRGEGSVAVLGDGIAGRRPVPAPVLDGAGKAVAAEAVVSGADFTCAIVGGGVRCWGWGYDGALGGGGGQPDSAVPVTVSHAGAPLSGIVEIAAGGLANGGPYSHACARKDDGTVYCWGNNQAGQLGMGSMGGILAPVVVPLGGPATALALGELHSCAALADGTAKCWGYNEAGQLGIGSKDITPTPTLVQGLAGVEVTGLAAGASHTCAIGKSGAIIGAVRCWGDNSTGQIGNPGVGSGGSMTPVQTSGLDGIANPVASISAGFQHTCVVVKGGKAMCWGYGSYGQLGNGGTAVASAPVLVKAVDGNGDLADVASVDAGSFHTCARLSSGALRCWGSNATGQLGTGGYASSSLPVAVTGPGGAELDVAAVSAGGSHTCAIATAGGTLSCWGSRYSGQLGDGILGYAATPVLTGPKAIGTVTFRDRGKVIGTATLVNGVATLKKKLAAGLHSLTASYAGGSVFSASASKAVAHLVTGTPGADRITGTKGKDTLKGMAGADRIAGGNGDDVIDGGSGNDVLTGGSGRDRLTGGTGRDRFVFRRASDSPRTRPDTVTDFRAGDRIDLSAFDIRPRSKKTERFRVYIGKRKFTGRAGEVRFDARRSTLEGDVNGDRRADFRVRLTGVKTLRASAVKLR
jgi:alpha-tubulin suppressor-like RCC1 family protein